MHLGGLNRVRRSLVALPLALPARLILLSLSSARRLICACVLFAWVYGRHILNLQDLLRPADRMVISRQIGYNL